VARQRSAAAARAVARAARAAASPRARQQWRPPEVRPPAAAPRAQNLPFFRIVVAEARAKRDGRHLDKLGWYDPHPGPDGNKHIGLNFERIKCAGASWAARRGGARRRDDGGGDWRRLLRLATAAPPLPPPDPALPWPTPAFPALALALARYWLAVGAHPSERVAYLLGRAGLIPPPPLPPVHPKQLPKVEAKS
jgi:ribosomal protein S16